MSLGRDVSIYAGGLSLDSVDVGREAQESRPSRDGNLVEACLMVQSCIVFCIVIRIDPSVFERSRCQTCTG